MTFIHQLHRITTNSSFGWETQAIHRAMIIDFLLPNKPHVIQQPIEKSL